MLKCTVMLGQKYRGPCCVNPRPFLNYVTPKVEKDGVMTFSRMDILCKVGKGRECLEFSLLAQRCLVLSIKTENRRV